MRRLSMRRLIRGPVAALAALTLATAALAGVATVSVAPAAAVSVAPAASAQNNGVGLTPPLGWSSWSFIRHGPTAAIIGAQADAMRSSGLARAGYQYVNLDDFWYQCPGSQGPNVDQYGRWVIDGQIPAEQFRERHPGGRRPCSRRRPDPR